VGAAVPGADLADGAERARGRPEPDALELHHRLQQRSPRLAVIPCAYRQQADHPDRDSQGAAILIHLISTQVDHEPSALRRLLVAVLVGGNLQAGQQVACVNPAALAGGTGELAPYIQTNAALGLKEPVHTTWVTYPELYSATCEQGGGASWLQITSLAGTSGTRPVVSEYGVSATDTGPAWGFHGYEYGLTLGNLLQDVIGEEAAWESSH